MTSFSCLMTILAFYVTHAHAHRLVPRSDHRSPLEEKVEDLSAELGRATAKLNALETSVGQLSTQVGFTVLVSENHPVTLHSIVKFDRQLYNQGGHYDTDTGFFTVPVSGVYSFFLSCEILPNQEMGYSVLKSGVTILEAHGGKSDNSAQTASSHVVLHATKGEHVWVRSFWKDGVARTWTSFGGALLTPDV
ncbi:cerebellin-1-like [Babylonia areolata]|uniref:cerebellin-1-like n=1 Tax=Babylonia areolata TaxID=304850 RepID=UPI003FD494C9